MYAKYFVALAVAASSVIAQTINTPPSLVQCQPTQISWNGGTAPYFLSIIPGGQPSAAALKDFGSQEGTSYTWTVDLASGTEITFKLVDSTGANVYSSPVTIQAGSSNACLNSASASGSSAASSGSAAATSAGSATSASSAATSAVASASSAVSSSATSATSAVVSRASSASQAASSGASSVSSRVSSAASAASSAAATTSASSAQKTVVGSVGALILGAIGIVMA